MKAVHCLELFFRELLRRFKIILFDGLLFFDSDFTGAHFLQQCVYLSL